MKQAMIFAAGLGTRLKPLTDTRPKALVEVGGKPLLAHVIEQLQASGYEHLVVNVHHFADQIESFLRSNQNFGIDIRVSDERDMLLDTGGGLKKAAPLFDPEENVLLHNVDIFSNVDYEWFARQHQPQEDAVLLVSRRKTKRYLLFDGGMRLMGWVNIETGAVKSPFPWLRNMPLSSIINPDDPSVPVSLHTFAFSGIHSFSPRLFGLMDRFPERFPIIDFYLSICHRSHIVGCVKDDLQVVDVGKPESLSAVGDLLSVTNSPFTTPTR